MNLLNSQFAQCCGSGGGGSEAREEDQDGDRKEVTSSAFAIRTRGVTSLCPAARLYILSMHESMSCGVQQPVEPYWHICIYVCMGVLTACTRNWTACGNAGNATQRSFGASRTGALLMSWLSFTSCMTCKSSSHIVASLITHFNLSSCSG